MKELALIEAMDNDSWSPTKWHLAQRSRLTGVVMIGWMGTGIVEESDPERFFTGGQKAGKRTLFFSWGIS